jgi:hypothetical protein
MLFDPILNSVLSEDIEGSEYQHLGKPLVCAHCYRPIKGRLHQSGENFYDEYCWQFKFVIDPLYIQRAIRKTTKNLDEDDNDY